MKALIILANGFEDIEAAGTIAILRRGGMELDIATIEEGIPQGKYGIRIDGAIPLNQIEKDDYGIVILPGGPGYVGLQSSESVKNIVTDFYAKKKYVAAICAAPTILGTWGMLNNRTYTCFPGMQEDGFLGTYSEAKAVIDKTIITGKAAGAVTDFALAILSEIQGKEVSNRIKEEIYY